MKHQTIGLFAQPLTRINVNVNGVAEFFDSVIKVDGGKSNQDRHVGDSGLVHYHNDTNVFRLYDQLADLESEILKGANFVYKDVMNCDSELGITNAWFNECAMGSSQFMHNHCNAVLCGTVYIRTDENTFIQFQNPFGISETVCNLSDVANTERDNPYGYHFHFPQVTVNVGNGNCLFWPSYLKHGYSGNTTPGRLSLSFNLMPRSFSGLYNPYFSS